MITYKGRGCEAGESGSSLEQLRRIKQELSYYQELASRLSGEVKLLTSDKSDVVQELRLRQSELRRLEQQCAQQQQELLSRQTVCEQLSAKLAELEQRSTRHERLCERLKREKVDLQQ